MDTDVLQDARSLLSLATNAIDARPNAAPAMAQAAQAAALIALVERMDTMNAHLAVIRDHLDDAGTAAVQIAGILDSGALSPINPNP